MSLYTESFPEKAILIFFVKIFMRRFASRTSLICVVAGSILLASCSSGSPTHVTNNEVPASVALSPSTDVSLQLGGFQTFSATAKNAGGNDVTETFTFESSNTAVVTVAANGLACAGTWDSLTAPTVCTPGETGTAQVSATANGVTSPPVTIYVHQHITNVVVSKVANQPATLSPDCFSKGAPGGPESALYQAFAYNVTSSGATDITASVGPFSWQSLAPGTSTPVSLSTPSVGNPQCLRSSQGQCLNLETATANVPGTTSIFASVDGVNSQPVVFTTCPVQSISISALGNPSSSFVVSTGASTTLNATVTDTDGMIITGVPLTWSSSDPASVGVTGATSTVYGSVGTVTSPAVGAAAVTASCTPAPFNGCNVGISPSLPIYPTQPITFNVRPTSSTTSASTALVTTTACNTTNQTCFTRAVPISRASASSGSGTPPFAAGAPINLPGTPNSILSDRTGANSYLGVDNSAFGTKGLIVLGGSSASEFNGAAGKPLAVSPDGNTVVLSDTSDTPNQVTICNNCAGAGRSATSFLMNGATAAAFSPDNLKAYIVSGESCPGTTSLGCLLIFSKVDAPQFVQLNAPASDVAFIGSGMLGYIAGGNPAGASFLSTCDHPSSSGPLTGVNMASEFLRQLPDGLSAVSLAPPDIQMVTASVTGTPVNGTPGCPAPRGFLNISNVVGSAINLGQGNFTPAQFLISSDGSMAYIVAEVVPQQRTAVKITAVGQDNTHSPAVTTYSYSLTSGPPLQVGQSIVISGMQTLGDNGTFNITSVTASTFAVNNSAGVNSSNENGTGTVIPRLPFVIAFNLDTQITSEISLSDTAAPLSAALSAAGDVLFVGAADGQVHVIDTASQTDIQQVPLTFPDSSLCIGQGSPATQVAITCNPDLIVAH